MIIPYLARWVRTGLAARLRIVGRRERETGLLDRSRNDEQRARHEFQRRMECANFGIVWAERVSMIG